MSHRRASLCEDNDSRALEMPKKCMKIELISIHDVEAWSGSDTPIKRSKCFNLDHPK